MRASSFLLFSLAVWIETQRAFALDFDSMLSEQGDEGAITPAAPSDSKKPITLPGHNDKKLFSSIRSQCPAGHPRCTKKGSRRLFCGENNCFYDNPSCARSAGFRVRKECGVERLSGPVKSPAPPAWPPRYVAPPSMGYYGDECPHTHACTYDLNAPVSCGASHCHYPNMFCALEQGFQPEQCTEEDFCPKAEVCPMEYNPVYCGPNNCRYTNIDCALSSGFGVLACSTERRAPYGGPTICPLAIGQCDASVWEPLLCGQGNCLYDNQCLASYAGFQGSDCMPIDLYCTSQLSGVCLDTWAPLVCGPRKCLFANECEASVAGFLVDADCSK